MTGSTRRWALAVFVVGLGVRLVNLDSPLWYDEVQLLVELLREPLHIVVGTYESDNNHTFYSLLAWLSVRAFGESAFALRLPAALFGAGSLALLVVLGARLGARREGILAALLLLVSYHHVWFSQNARGYTGLLFFTLLATLGFLKARATGSWRDILLQGLWLALATWIHLTAVYVAAAQVVAAVLTRAGGAEPAPAGAGHPRARWAPLLGVVAGGAISLVLHAPVIVPMFRFFTGWNSGDRVEAVWRSPLWMFDAARASFGLSWPAFTVLLLAGAAVGIWSLASFGRRSPAFPALVVLPAVLGFSVSLLLERNLWPRFFFFEAGFAALLFARALHLVAARLVPRSPRLATRTAAATLIALAGLSCLLLPKAWYVPKQDFGAARDYVRSHSEDGERVLTVGLAVHPYRWLYDPSFTPVESLEELQRLLAAHPRAWLLTTFPQFLAAKAPALDAAVRERFEVVHRIQGSVGDGDIVVMRAKG